MKIACFTIVKNEWFHLPVWCDYYSKSLPNSDLFILNHQTSDESVEMCQKKYEVFVQNVENETTFDHNWLRQIVQNYQQELLKTYDVVIFAECDEYLIPNSKFKTLEECITNYFSVKKSNYMTAVGWEVIQRPNTESDIDLSNPLILNDRKIIVQNPAYSKTLITKVPLSWGNGFHRLAFQRKSYKYRNPPISSCYNDPAVHLLHTQFIDLNLYRARYNERSQWKKKDIPQGSSRKEDVVMIFESNLLRYKAQPLFEDWKKLLYLDPHFHEKYRSSLKNFDWEERIPTLSVEPELHLLDQAKLNILFSKTNRGV